MSTSELLPTCHVIHCNTPRTQDERSPCSERVCLSLCGPRGERVGESDRRSTIPDFNPPCVLVSASSRGSVSFGNTLGTLSATQSSLSPQQAQTRFENLLKTANNQGHLPDLLSYIHTIVPSSSELLYAYQVPGLQVTNYFGTVLPEYCVVKFGKSTIDNIKRRFQDCHTGLSLLGLWPNIPITIWVPKHMQSVHRVLLTNVCVPRPCLQSNPRNFISFKDNLVWRMTYTLTQISPRTSRTSCTWRWRIHRKNMIFVVNSWKLCHTSQRLRTNGMLF